jgi:hypothetical protein
MKLKITAAIVAISFAVTGALVAATQDQSAKENGQVVSQSTKDSKKEKPNGQAGSTFRRLGF